MDLLAKLREGLSATRAVLAENLPPRVNPEAIEEALVLADAGLLVAEEVAVAFARAQKKGLIPPGKEGAWLVEQVAGLLDLPRRVVQGSPHVTLVVGVNGSGKTTTAAKLAARVKQEGGKPLLVAADTFRAAAVEQLQLWAQRLEVEVVAHRPGADPAAVVYDGLQAAKARGATHVFVDTAGRLHTKHHLMQELGKVAKICQRIDERAPHEVLLVLDASTGGNGLHQAREFAAAAGITGVVLTKLDGTAKGGVVLSVARELGAPVVWVGVGEGAGDLLPFEPRTFAQALLEGVL